MHIPRFLVLATVMFGLPVMAQNYLKPKSPGSKFPKTEVRETDPSRPEKEDKPTDSLFLKGFQQKAELIQPGNLLMPQIVDVDGNIYNTIRIGNQVWMKENLRTTRYRDGSSIELVPDGYTWKTQNDAAYCWYDNDIAKYRNSKYGALYNWYTVNSRNLCPTGWHVPTLDELETLILELGGAAVAGASMKATGTEYWHTPNVGATDQSGFSGMGNGKRNSDGEFEHEGIFGDWWSITEQRSDDAYYLILDHGLATSRIRIIGKNAGLGVRCLQGEAAFPNTIRKDSLPTISDIEGNVYHTVTIGTQTWMAENLKTTKLNDGKNILNFDQWTVYWCDDPQKPTYAWYNYDVNSKQRYGALYNWYAVNTGKLCPVGWHVPTHEEWGILEDHLFGINVAGGKLKERGTTHWKGFNFGATNETGFSALPGGFYEDGKFKYAGYNGVWWTSTESGSSWAYFRRMYSGSSYINGSTQEKRNGYSVRCIKN